MNSSDKNTRNYSDDQLKEMASLRRRVESILDAAKCQSDAIGKMERGSLEVKEAKANESSLLLLAFELGIQHNAILDLCRHVERPSVEIKKRDLRSIHSLQRKLVQAYEFMYEVHRRYKETEHQLGEEQERLEMEYQSNLNSATTYAKQLSIENRHERKLEQIESRIEKSGDDYEKAYDKYDKLLDKLLLKTDLYYYVDLNLEDDCLTHGLRYRVDSDDLSIIDEIRSAMEK